MAENEVASSSIDDEWVKYWENPLAGENGIELSEKYAVLIVLRGKIELTLKGYKFKRVSKESLVVVDVRQITQFTWEAGTAILRFTPPEKIFRFFASCSSVFNMPCSNIVPVRPLLQKWIDDLMGEQHQPKELLTDIRRRQYCVRLGNILRSYPPLLVGELLVPFQACSITGATKCKGESCI